MKRPLESIAWIAGVGLVLWAILFGSFWMVRNGCAGNMVAPHCDGSPIIDWVGNLVMLGWVKDYQTLISGFLALIAGATVLVATRQQIAATREEGRRQRNEGIRTSLAMIRSQFTRAALDLQLKGGGAVQLDVQPLAASVAAAHTSLAQQLIIVAGYINESCLRAAAESVSAAQRTEARNSALLHIYAVERYLTRINRFFDKEGFFKNEKLPLSELKDALEFNGVEYRPSGMLATFYKDVDLGHLPTRTRSLKSRPTPSGGT